MASILKKREPNDGDAVAPGRSSGSHRENDAAANETPRSTSRPAQHRSGSVRVIKHGAPPEGGETTTGKADGPKQDGSNAIATNAIAKNGVASLISGATIGKQSGGATGLVEFNLSDLAEQGREQIRRCQQQIEAMLTTARQQADQIKADAKAQGHAEGKSQAAAEIDNRIRAEAEVKAKAQVASLQKAVSDMRQQYDRWMHQYAEVLTATALAATERLIRREIRLPAAKVIDAGTDSAAVADPNRDADRNRDGDHNGQEQKQEQEHLLVRWAREALHSTRSASRLTLAVHPDTLAELGKSLDELLAHPDLPEQSFVIPDETLQIGDIIVRQDGGEISAGLDAQLRRLAEELQ